MTDQLDLDALQALCDAATPGEAKIVGKSIVVEAQHLCMFKLGWKDHDDWRPDAELLVGARNALPLLIAEVRKLWRRFKCNTAAPCLQYGCRRCG